MSSAPPEEKPPIFRNWNTWYWVVWLIMIAQLILYLLIARSF